MSAPVPHRDLGRSGLSVSRIALGSWRTFERMDRAAAESVLAHALAQGIDFLDDARYDDETGRAPLASGYSEVLFGELFRSVGADRNAVVVSNKLWWEFWPRQGALSELEGSLERMGFDRLDVLYSSTLPDAVPVPVAVEQIASVLQTGRARAWAVVNWSAQAVAEAAAEATGLAIPQPCAVQLPYSLARLDWVEDPAMEDVLATTGAALIPSAVLAGGALSGKYDDGGAGRLAGRRQEPTVADAILLGARLRAPARRLDTTPAALAIAFTLRHPRAASTLIGATSPAQVDAALGAMALAERLTPADIEELRALAQRAE